MRIIATVIRTIRELQYLRHDLALFRRHRNSPILLLYARKAFAADVAQRIQSAGVEVRRFTNAFGNIEYCCRPKQTQPPQKADITDADTQAMPALQSPTPKRAAPITNPINPYTHPLNMRWRAAHSGQHPAISNHAEHAEQVPIKAIQPVTRRHNRPA